MAFDFQGDGDASFSDGLSDVFGMSAHQEQPRGSSRVKRNQSLSSLSTQPSTASGVLQILGPVVHGPHALALRDVLDCVSRGEFQDAAKQLTDLLEGKGPRTDTAPLRSTLSHSWQSLLDAFNRIFLQAEKAYYTMAYVSRHSPGELAGKYDTFAERLKVVGDSVSPLSSEITAEEARSFWTDALHLAKARRQSIHIYHEIFGTSDSMAHPNRLEEMAQQLYTVASDLAMNITAPAARAVPGGASIAGPASPATVAPASSAAAASSSIFLSIIENSVMECRVLSCLLRAQVAITQVQFKDAMIPLYQCKNLFEGWEASFARSPEDQRAPVQLPQVCHTLKTVYKHLVAKSSVYFQTLVGKGAPIEVPPKFKTVPGSKRTKEYYVQWAMNLQRNTKALFVCMILSTQGSTAPFNEYRHPAMPYDPPSGLRSFPVIFATPIEPARSHIITIVSVITDQEMPLASRKVVFFDEGEFRTKAEKEKEKHVFFIAQVEDRVFTVVVFFLKGKKLERDADSQSRRFLEDFSRELRLWQFE